MAFRPNISRQSILVILMLMSVVAIIIGPSAGMAVRKPAMFILPFAEWGTRLTIWGKSHVNNVAAETIPQDEARQLKARNEALESKVQALSSQLAGHLEQLRKVQQLRSLSFGPVEDIPCELIPARVVADDSMVYGETLVVKADRPTRSGLAVTTRQLVTDRSKAIGPNKLAVIALPPDLEALSSAVLAGRLLESGGHMARLELVTNKHFKIRARIGRRIAPDHPDPTRRELSDANIYLINVEACGDGKDSLLVSNVKASDHILIGDWLVTCSDDPLLPAQIHVGYVVDVTADPRLGGFVNLRIKPSADLDTLREVFVVAPRGKDAQDKD